MQTIYILVDSTGYRCWTRDLNLCMRYVAEGRFSTAYRAEVCEGWTSDQVKEYVLIADLDTLPVVYPTEPEQPTLEARVARLEAGIKALMAVLKELQS